MPLLLTTSAALGHSFVTFTEISFVNTRSNIAQLFECPFRRQDDKLVDRLWAAAKAPKGTHMEYKVITQRDGVFSGSFDADSLEQTLNDFAAEGWRVVSSFTTASIWKSVKSEIMIVMERKTS